MVGISMPIIYFLIFFLCIILYSLLTKKKHFPWYMVSASALFLIIYLQPDLISQLISQAACLKIGDTYYILANKQFECFTDEYYKYFYCLILPFLMLWLVIIPLTLFLFLRRNKDNLKKQEVMILYGFIYKEYDNKAYYWELIKMI